MSWLVLLSAHLLHRQTDERLVLFARLAVSRTFLLLLTPRPQMYSARSVRREEASGSSDSKPRAKLKRFKKRTRGRVKYLCSTDATMKPREANSAHIAEYRVLQETPGRGASGRRQQTGPSCGSAHAGVCVYLKAPRPWEKMTTGHFSSHLNGASTEAGIL